MGFTFEVLDLEGASYLEKPIEERREMAADFGKETARLLSEEEAQRQAEEERARGYGRLPINRTVYY